MAKIGVNGSNNISNSGVIDGNFIVGDTYVGLPEIQKKLVDIVEKLTQVELIRAEADKNNSIANLNYSKIMLEDRAIIKQMMEKLK